MQLTSLLLPLPAPLLLLIATLHPSAGAVEERQWPYNLPAHVKYWPEDPPHRRRDLEVIEQHILAGKNPIAIKKMGDDQGEKFFVEYWRFEETYQAANFEDDFSNFYEPPMPRSLRSEIPDEPYYMNGSIVPSFRHPFALHENKDTDIQKGGWSGLAALFGRGSDAFTCPAGTSSCANINQPNACCATGETCFTITDTGLGDVGCCPNGETCTGEDISCPANYATCPDNTGGGCCIPGYVCDGPGCIPSQSVVTVVETITVKSSKGSSVQIITTTTVDSLTSVSATATATDTSIQTTLSCSASYRACPINQGGGCCLTNRECGVTDCPTSPGGSSSSSDTLTFTTATGTAVIPVRPTSSSTITIFTSKASGTAIATGSTCPIGFYGCSAVHGGGCCQTGRNCDTTDCPATKSTTIIAGDETIVVPITKSTTIIAGGETIVVPVSTTAGPLATTVTVGACATGWSSCASVLGGGCCPTGYDCGTASCSSFSGTRTVEIGPKESASGVGRSRRMGMKGWLGGVFAVCWIGGVIMILMMMWF